MIEDVIEFHKKFDIKPLDKPGFLSEEEMGNRLSFQLEELDETAKAAGFKLLIVAGKTSYKRDRWAESKQNTESLVEIFDGLIDQLYVLLGTLYLMGFFSKKGMRTIFYCGWKRVHGANMKKEKKVGQWKISKPEGWERPSLEDLVS